MRYICPSCLQVWVHPDGIEFVHSTSALQHEPKRGKWGQLGHSLLKYSHAQNRNANGH